MRIEQKYIGWKRPVLTIPHCNNRQRPYIIEMVLSARWWITKREGTMQRAPHWVLKQHTVPNGHRISLFMPDPVFRLLFPIMGMQRPAHFFSKVMENFGCIILK